MHKNVSARTSPVKAGPSRANPRSSSTDKTPGAGRRRRCARFSLPCTDASVRSSSPCCSSTPRPGWPRRKAASCRPRPRPPTSSRAASPVTSVRIPTQANTSTSGSTRRTSASPTWTSHRRGPPTVGPSCCCTATTSAASISSRSSMPSRKKASASSSQTRSATADRRSRLRRTTSTRRRATPS